MKCIMISINRKHQEYIGNKCYWSNKKGKNIKKVHGEFFTDEFSCMEVILKNFIKGREID